MATITSAQSGAWTSGSTWVGGSKPADGDTVVIAAGHSIAYDEDMSAWANGIAGLTIEGHATTPAMLHAKYSAAGTYHLKIKTGGTIAGTSGTLKGRLLANSDGVWGNTGALPFDRKFIVDLKGTARIVALYLDIALYATEPTYRYVATYGTKYEVLAVDTETDTLTLSAAHGWSANTPVMVRSSGTLPAPLEADAIYYVCSPSGAELRLATVSGGPAIDLTSAGSGTIEVYSGHTNTGTATIKVLTDVTGDACWTTAAGHNAVVLADAGPADYDQQRVTLASINAGSITLSANVDSAQYPGARIWLVSRNVSIRSDTTTGTNIVDYSSAAHGGVFACEIRSTAGSGTTFYANGVVYGSGHVISGTVSGCNYGVNYGSGHVISGTVSGCNYGVVYGSGHVISGTVSGCNYGVVYGSGHVISGTVSGCNYGVAYGSGHVISGTVSGCNYGVAYGSGHVISGTVSGCANGMNSGSGHVISGTVSGCNYGVVYGSARFAGASLYGNTRDLYLATTMGRASLLSATPNGAYKYTTVSLQPVPYAAMVSPYNSVAGSHGCWTQGGKSLSETYSDATHGTPPIAPPDNLVHVLTAEDSNRHTYVEFPVRVPAGARLVVTLYGRLTGTSTWLERPTIGVYDPYAEWQSEAERLAVSSALAATTDWQTVSATYAPSADTEAVVRVQCKGGTSDGTGTEQMQWLLTIRLGAGRFRHALPFVPGGQ